MIELRQSTDGQEVPLGYFLDSTNGNDEETGLTIANTDIKIWKWGATSLVSKNSGGGTHMSNGIYYATLDATDSNTLGPLVIFIHVSGALPVRVECAVLPANVWDAKYGSDKLQVDVTQIGGDTQSATDLKDFADAGYDPSTNKVEGVKLVDTTTTNTDMVAEAPTAAAVADAVWDEAIADHTAAGSFGEEVQAHATSSEISALNDLSAADVNAEVVDALNVDTYAEPGQGAPASTASLVAKIGYLYKAWRNKTRTTATQLSIYNDAGDTVDQKAPLSDDGTNFDKSEIGSGP